VFSVDEGASTPTPGACGAVLGTIGEAAAPVVLNGRVRPTARVPTTAVESFFDTAASSLNVQR
jgi:hypothetical protein